MSPVWWKGATDVEKSCKCEGKGCQCGGKSPMKTFKKQQPAAMFKNDAGTSFALSYIASEVGRYFGHMFGAFTIAEEDGKLVIHTGMRRDEHMEALAAQHCTQPCPGACEDGCKSKRSTREVAGL